MAVKRTNYMNLGYGYALGEHEGQEEADRMRVQLDFVALHAFACNALTTGGLVYGWLGGNVTNEGGVYVQIAAGTVAVVPSTVTYIERTHYGVVSTNTSGWTTGKVPMARVTTDAEGITNVEDFRPAVLQGVQGPMGMAIMTGSTVPSDGDGTTGQLYLRTTNGQLYVKGASTWSTLVNITGPTGATGATGATGQAVLVGSGAPSDGDGTLDQLYVATTTGNLYKKGASTWSLQGCLQGPQGIQGIQGNTGPSNTLAIGTVTNGTSVDASITGSSPNQTLNLTLPTGPQGPAGSAPPTDISWFGSQYTFVHKPATLQPPSVAAALLTDKGFFVGNASTTTGYIRRTEATVVDAYGTWPVYTKPRTNYCPQSKDMKTTWAPTNMTVVDNGVGPDGSTAAQMLSATAGNATLIMDCGTVAYMKLTGSLYLKRKTGTGNIDLTLDGGATWTTKSITGGWARYDITQWLANPDFGIRIVTNGDEVWATVAQVGEHRPGITVPSRPINTTTVAVTDTPDFTTTSFQPVFDFAPTLASALPTAQLWNTWEAARTPYTTSRTNLLSNPTLLGGTTAPTGWTADYATGTSAAATSIYGNADGASAWSFSGTAQRATYYQVYSGAANTSYVFALYIESITGTITAQNLHKFSAYPAGSTITYPICAANPSGGAAGNLTTGLFYVQITTAGTSGNITNYIGLGATANSTGTINISRVKFEVGSTPTDFCIGTVPSEYDQNPTLFLQDALGKVKLSPSARTNLAVNSILAGGTTAPTSWTATIATGTSAAATSLKGNADGASAWECTCSTQRVIISQTTPTLAANTTYCLSIELEAVSAPVLSYEIIAITSAPSGSTVTWPTCPANPGGTLSNNLVPGRLWCLVAVGSTPGTAVIRYGAGCSSNVTVTARMSRPTFEVGSIPSGAYIPTTSTAVTRTDYTLGANGVVTFGFTPATGAIVSWLGSSATYTPGLTCIVPASAVGAWAAKDNQLATYTGTGWAFTTPPHGRRVYGYDQAQHFRYDTSVSLWRSEMIATPDGGYATSLIAGENVARGEVVYSKVSGGTDERVWKNPIDGDSPVGVVYADATAGSEVLVVWGGRAMVLPNAADTATRGYAIYSSSTTAGRVSQSSGAPSSTNYARGLGHFIATGSGAGVLTSAMIQLN